MGQFCRITIPERIKLYRREHNVTQSGFGQLMGVSAQAVCKWEQGICYPDITVLPRLASILHCRIDDFFEDERFCGA